MLRVLSFISFLFLSTVAMADVSIHETNSFDRVSQLVDEKQKAYGVDRVLLVFDIDNTLLTGDEDLGSDVWYQWQAGYLGERKPSKSQKLSGKCLLNAIGLLYEVGTMKPTEDQVPSLLADWGQRGYTMLALTSRGPAYRAATERELSRATTSDGTSLLTLLQTHALAPIGEYAPVYRYTATSKGKTRTHLNKSATLREVSYMNGVMMTSGMHKGAMLEQILQKTHRSFTAIIFVDDTHKNIVRLEESFEHHEDIDMNIVYYQKIENDRIERNKAASGEATVLTQAQADAMHKQWVKLNKTLTEVFPERKAHDALPCD